MHKKKCGIHVNSCLLRQQNGQILSFLELNNFFKVAKGISFGLWCLRKDTWGRVLYPAQWQK